MNIEKCHFCVYEVEALGHKISNKGLLPLEKKVDVIQIRKSYKYHRITFLFRYGRILEHLLKITRQNLLPFVNF